MNKTIALTFDDGPTLNSLAIIEALQKNKAQATFFVNGSCLNDNAEITKYAYDIGCEIGTHTENHEDLTTLTEEKIIAEIMLTAKKIRAITGEKPKIFRPPFGYYDDKVKQMAAACKLPLIIWSIDPRDWESDDANTTKDRVLQEIKEGAVVLCHDRMASTSELMIHFIPELIEMGYELVTVSKLYKLRNVQLLPGNVYFSPDMEVR